MVQGGKIPGAIPVSGSPQRPGWVCPEDRAVGIGVPVSSWVWNHFSLLALYLYNCQAEQKLWEEKPEFLIERRSPQDRGRRGYLISITLVFCFVL